MIGYYTIYGYENHLKSADVFKDLYIEIMPKAVRQYFTPAWFAAYKVYNKGLVGIVLSKDRNNTYKVKFFTRENKALVIISVPRLLLITLVILNLKSILSSI